MLFLGGSEAIATPIEWDALRSAPSTSPPVPWARASALLVPAAGLVAVEWALRGRQLQRPFLVISALSVLTRALTPLVPMHIQTDDLRLVATARGVEGFDVEGFNSMSGLVVPLFRGALALWGDDIHSAFMVAQVAGVLLPPLTVLLAWQWFRNETWPIAAGTAVLVSPVAWAYSGAITAYLPAATLFALSLVLSLLARNLSVPRRLVLHTASGAALLAAALLKPEFVFFVPAHAVLVTSRWEARGLRRLEPLVVPAAVTAILLFYWAPYLDDFFDTIRGRSASVGRKRPSSFVIYAILGFFCLNPPFLPLKLMFVRSFRGPEASQTRWLRWFVLGFASIYFVSMQPIGFNQWRHSLAFTVPFFVAIAPNLWRLKEEIAAGRWRARLFLAHAAAFGLAGYGAYAVQAMSKQDVQALSARPRDARTLVLFLDHPRDLSPANALAVTGTASFLSLEELWPQGSEVWSAIRLADVRLDAREAARRVDGWFTRFASISTLDDDLEWLKDKPTKRPVDSLLERAHAIKRVSAQGPSTEHSSEKRHLLAGFDRVLLFVDSESAYQARYARWIRSFGFAPDNLHEPLEIAARRMRFVGLPEGATPSLEEPHLVEVSRIVGDDGLLLWERR